MVLTLTMLPDPFATAGAIWPAIRRTWRWRCSPRCRVVY
jgi:hypothetical protein